MHGEASVAGDWGELSWCTVCGVACVEGTTVIKRVWE